MNCNIYIHYIDSLEIHSIHLQKFPIFNLFSLAFILSSIALCFSYKNLLFLFYTSIFTKHLHQFIYSTHLFNKIFNLFTFFIISFPLLSPLWNPLTDPTQTQNHPHPAANYCLLRQVIATAIGTVRKVTVRPS